MAGYQVTPDIRMAIHNLIKNAVEALMVVESDRNIDFAATLQLERVHLSIADNGPGLPADRRHEPFAPGLSHKGGGMGLGLAVARDCIEAMGGTIGVRTSGPHGTCIEITLRCVHSS